ncbi:MAG: hypothetical protein K0Q73_7427 [Paenibacillus sp.]|jgi:hypothetical protein|nr:hypothetical protein [Paenibacillus sp.]
MFKPLYFIFFHALLRTPIWGSFAIPASLEIQDKTKRTATAYPKAAYHSPL